MRRRLPRPRAARAALALTGVLAAGAPLLVAGPAGAAPVTVIVGGGWGHGIGMSQYGAQGMALDGATAPQILAHYYRQTTLSTQPSGRTIRVLLGDGVGSYAFVATAGQAIVGADGARRDLVAGRPYSLGAGGSGGQVVATSPAGQTPFAAPARVTGGDAGVTRVAGSPYRGVIEVAPRGGSVDVVNEVGMDDYVRGVVARESPASWEPAALQAQAVAARSYALTEHRGGPRFDVYPDTRSQVYGGTSAETPTTDAAVAATAGQVLTFGGAIATTYFSSTSGGRTASVEDVFLGADPEPYLTSVPDPDDKISPLHRWGPVRLSAGTIAAKLGLRGSLLGVVPGTVRHGRVLSLRILGTGGEVSRTGPDVQARLGLRSTLFTVATFDVSRRGRTLTARVSGVPSVAVQRLVAGRWQTLRTVRVPVTGGRVSARAARATTRVPYRLAAGRATSPTVVIGPGSGPKASSKPTPPAAKRPKPAPKPDPQPAPPPSDPAPAPTPPPPTPGGSGTETAPTPPPPPNG